MRYYQNSSIPGMFEEGYFEPPSEIMCEDCNEALIPEHVYFRLMDFYENVDWNYTCPSCGYDVTMTNHDAYPSISMRLNRPSILMGVLNVQT